MNKNFSNNEAANNNNNFNNGGIVMINGTMNMKSFAEVVVMAMEGRYGEGYTVETTTITKNNDCQYVGLVIKDGACNVCPTLYLEGFFQQYKAGRAIEDIFDEIASVYENYRVSGDFDVSSITDYSKAKESLCIKLVSASKNQKLLESVPHVKVLDMAMLFYVIVGRGADGLATVRWGWIIVYVCYIDKFLILTYNNITNTCKTTTQSMVKEELLWQNRY